MLLIQTAFEVSQQVFYGDVTAGSPKIENIHRGDGWGAELPDYIKSNDRFFPPMYADAYGTPIGTGYDSSNVAAVGKGPKHWDLTMSSNAPHSGRAAIWPLPIA